MKLRTEILKYGRIRDLLVNLLFPPKCPFCGKVLDEPGLCAGCRKDLPWTEGDEGIFPLSDGVRCAAPLFYEEAVQTGILRFKFHGAAGAAEPLGGLLAQCAAERFAGAFDTVTWTPVSRKRLRRRGYDQARLLAESACRRWNTKPAALLRKTADNPAQSGLAGAAARRANVLGLYEADPAAAGRRILLMDDIVTTGATLSECARTLLAAGAAEVMCVTLARTRKKSGAGGDESLKNAQTKEKAAAKSDCTCKNAERSL